ncbi:osmoprotectant ABC transporter substrate-binding protein [Acetonema longum]|uniref:Putative glycine betaine/carnitine/choline-binding lipoprotein n=1 Tax=Acetonema longum DSM 6540 TaxID=1009370 RepID=F7NEG7_9FIRM|nr:osmoprotectant ABC transporter substrate-binding protein [Acetonema longum]EGO65378.1 putative glycine betaine/carnitine/choline-binding lipoprotein precursor [Acetonema longum DSM 6540]
MRKCIALLVIGILFITFTAGCGSTSIPTDSKVKPVRVGSLTFSESVILAEMIKLLLEENLGYQVDHVTNLSTSTIAHQAMINKEIDISSRYTGTEMTGPLEMDQPIRDPEKAFDHVQNEYQKRFQQTWLKPYGFENTYALTVRRDVAEKYGLKKVSDLAKVAANMRLGTDTSFLEREGDGYAAFCQLYGFKFGQTFPMEIGLVYQAVKSQQVDVVIAYSTDSRVKSFDLVVLEDDKRFFPPYEAAILIRNETLEQYKGLKEELEKLSGKISTTTMTELNYKVDEQKLDPVKVAREFLQQQGLLK